MPIILLGIVLILTITFTQVAVYFPVDFLFSLRLPFWFIVSTGLVLAAWLLED
jgi:hypothetical protein